MYGDLVYYPCSQLTFRADLGPDFWEIVVMNKPSVGSFKFLILSFFLLSFTIMPLNSFDFKGFLKDSLEKAGKAVAIAGLVRKLAPEINDFVNTLMLNQKVANREKTKVVPLFSFGDRSAIGGAQVSGPEYLLNQVRAVYQIDGLFQNGRFRVKALVPTTSSTELNRVHGVGVTAVVDYHVR